MKTWLIAALIAGMAGALVPSDVDAKRLGGGRPAGNPIEFVGGFLKDGKARGRPVGVTVDPRGALIVADDLSNTVWRVTPIHSVAPPKIV